MNSLIVSWAISSVLTFVDASIRNPKSPKARALAGQLRFLHAQLGLLLARFDEEGIILAD